MNPTVKKTSLLIIVSALCCVVSVHAQTRGPSTPEDRKHFVEAATYLEKNPLTRQARDTRAVLVVFLIQAPDMSVKVCTEVFGESKRLKGDYESELMTQISISEAKFIIENPDKAQDAYAQYVAGVEGVLRTWQAVKAEKPKAKFPLLDELLEKQRAGTLGDYVKANMAGCK